MEKFFLCIEIKQQLNIKPQGELIFSEPDENTLNAEELKWCLRAFDNTMFLVEGSDDKEEKLIINI